MIAIIDYGMGNIHSVQKALANLGADTLVANKPRQLENCDKLLLPGVGAFDDAAAELESRGLNQAINAQIKAGKIFLGICLGMQFLFEESQEAQFKKGLGILKGSVKKFQAKGDFKVPHMGWNQLKVKSECPLLKGIPDNSYVYFCHSYYPEPQNPAVIAATTDYITEFASVVWQENIYGAQFHPEKSQDTGLRILKNFINL